mgnify:CR=1 FL=1
MVHYFEANHKNLNLELPADIEDVAADPALLERVISNLLDNAFKWAPSQSTVTIRAHQSGNYAQIHFIDHGPGISQEHKQVVRQPFHRVGDKSQNGGLGLGLAIADRLVEGRRLPVRLGRPSFDGRNLSGSMYAIDKMWHVGDIVGVDDKNVLCQFRPIIDPDGPCLKGCNSITILMFDHDVNRVPYCGFLYPSEG